GVTERLAVVLVQLEALAVGDTFERLGQHVAVGDGAPVLHLGLYLVVRVEQQFSVVLGPEVAQRGADAAHPVDERAVAVEARPALRGHGADPTRPGSAGSCRGWARCPGGAV